MSARHAILRLLALLVALLALAGPARADDISAAARGTVRVVTIAVSDDKVVGFGHGSGFAIAPNRIVTNAHVVELAQRFPDNVVIGVVPSEGNKSYQAKVVAYDPRRDLALLEYEDATLPPLTLYTGPVDDDAQLFALGYPGNVDVATAQSAADFITPATPIRSEGVFSGRRNMSGTQVLLHTAQIARGNSGGPLLDPCGRVIGVNSAITHNEEGDASFAFAIADDELASFLREANQPYHAVGTPCTSMAQVMAEDQQLDAKAAADRAAALREAQERVAGQRAERLQKARDEAEAARENAMALAAVLLVAGALAVGGAGLLASKGKREPAWWTGGIGAALIVAAVAVFVTRPSGEVSAADVPDVAAAEPSALAAGKMVCSIVPERSRVTVSSTEDVPIDWSATGCMNGRTQYAEDGARWTRLLVPDDEQTVSVLDFDPAAHTYVVSRYLLGAGAMDAARKLRESVTVNACTPNAADRAALTTQQAAIRATLPASPNERLVYSCKPAG